MLLVVSLAEAHALGASRPWGFKRLLSRRLPRGVAQDVGGQAWNSADLSEACQLLES